MLWKYICQGRRVEQILFNILSQFITFKYLDNCIHTSFVLWLQTSEMLWAGLPTRPQISDAFFFFFPDAFYSLSFVCANWTTLIILYIVYHHAKVGRSGERTLEGLKPAIPDITNVISTHNQELVT